MEPATTGPEALIHRLKLLSCDINLIYCLVEACHINTIYNINNIYRMRVVIQRGLRGEAAKSVVGASGFVPPLASG